MYVVVFIGWVLSPVTKLSPGPPLLIFTCLNAICRRVRVCICINCGGTTLVQHEGDPVLLLGTYYIAANENSKKEQRVLQFV
jgi:hypothetical protein